MVIVIVPGVLMEKQTKAYALAVTAVLFWSTAASAFKLTLRHVDFLEMLLGASLVSLAFLFGTVLVQKKLYLLRTYSGKDYFTSALLGFLNPFLYYVILFKAYSILTAQEALTLNYTWPVMLVILSIPLLKQPVTLRVIFAFIISFTGVFVIATGGDITGFRFTTPLGAALALSSAVVWALFWIYNVRDKRDESVKLFLNFVFGSVFILASVLLFSEVKNPGTAGLTGVAYIGLFEMGLTFVFWLKALQLSRTTAQVSIFVYASPFLSLVFIHLVVGEKIAVSTVTGLALIIAGILVQHVKSRKK